MAVSRATEAASLVALERRAKRERARARHEYARSAALHDISRHLRANDVCVRSCAWCGAISLGEGWHRPDVTRLADELSRAPATHSICPPCFAKQAPGARYPG